MKKFALLFALMAITATAAQFPFALWRKSSRVTYFGNNIDSTTGAVLGTRTVEWNTDWYGTLILYGSPPASPSSVRGTFEYVCPGTGPQTVLSMEFLGWLRSAGGKIRMSINEYAEQSTDGGTIYDYTLNKLCEHSASVALSGTSSSPAWVGGSTGLTGTTALQGGKRYIVAVALDSGNAGYAFTAGAGKMTQLYGTDYTGGMPSSLSSIGASPNNDIAPIFRIKISGNGTSAAAATREKFYVNTDFAGTSTGSATNPYKFLQDVLVARTNKTFSLPIDIYCSGAANDTKAVSDASLGQFGATLTNQLYVIGDRTAATWDSAKYKLAPTDRTSYYGVLNMTKPYVNFDRMQYDLPSTTAGQNNEILYVSYGVYSNSIIRAPGGSDNTRYLSSVNPQATPLGGVKLVNILAYGMGSGSAGNSLKLHGLVYVYNSTLIGGSAANGVDLAVDGDLYISNTYISAGSTCIDSVGTIHANTTNATSDSTGTAGMRNIAVNTTNFSAPGSNDYRLATGSALRTTGTDNTGAEPLTTTDLIGATRAVPPAEIGALKY